MGVLGGCQSHQQGTKYQKYRRSRPVKLYRFEMRGLINVVLLIVGINTLLSLSLPVYEDDDDALDFPNLDMEPQFDFSDADQLSRGKRFWWLFKDRNRNRKSFFARNLDRRRWGDKHRDNKAYGLWITGLNKYGN